MNEGIGQSYLQIVFLENVPRTVQSMVRLHCHLEGVADSVSLRWGRSRLAHKPRVFNKGQLVEQLLFS